MQQASESKFTTFNQALEAAEKVFKGWLGPVVVDPSRKQLLENVAGIVARVLSDIDLGTMTPLYPKINEWIQNQSQSYRWREIKKADGSSYQPRRFAPNDETAIMAIAAACLIPHELPMPLLPDQQDEIEKRISAFLSGIERSAKAATYTDNDWYRFVDNAISNPTEAAIADLISAAEMYGKMTQEWVNNDAFGWLKNVKSSAELKQFADDQVVALKGPLTSVRFLRWIVKKITGK